MMTKPVRKVSAVTIGKSSHAFLKVYKNQVFHDFDDYVVPAVFFISKAAHV